MSEEALEAVARAIDPKDWKVIDLHLATPIHDSRADDMKEESLARASAAITAYLATRSTEPWEVGLRAHPKDRYHEDMSEREIERLARDMCAYPDIRAPVQGFAGGIPWEMHMRAYEVYEKKWRGQVALINLYGRGCRGGFGTCELDDFIPGWRDELTERTTLLKRIAELEAAQPATENAELVALRDALERAGRDLEDCRQWFARRQFTLEAANAATGIKMIRAALSVTPVEAR